MDKTEYRIRIRRDILDLEIDQVPNYFDDNSIDRAIESALEDLSRFIPAELFHEITISNSDISETFSSTGIVAGSIITLANRAVKLDSVGIVQSSTTFVKDTDFVVDHMAGTITIPSGSAIISLADSLTCTITYKKSRIVFDLASLTNMRMLMGVAVISGSQVMQTEDHFDLFGDFLIHTNQQEVLSGTKLIIRYEARHTIADDSDPGTLPEALAELVIKGAEAALLYAKAISLELSQSDNFDDLTEFDTYFSEVLTDLTSGRASLASATSSLAAVIIQMAAYFSAWETDYVAAQLAVTQAGTFLGNVAAQLTAAVAAIDTEVGVDLGTVQTHIASATGQVTAASALMTTGATFIDAEVVTDLGDAKTKLATTGQGYLDTGDDKISTVNPGLDEAGKYATYAQQAASLASQIIEVGKGRVLLADEYLKYGELTLKESEVYLTAAADNLESAKIRLSTPDAYATVAKEYVEAAQTRLQEAQIQLSTATRRAELLNLILQEPDNYVKIAQGYQQEAQIRLAAISAGVARAGEVRAQSTFIVELAERIRQEANRRYQDFQGQISDRNQTRRRQGIVARNQI